MVIHLSLKEEIERAANTAGMAQAKPDKKGNKDFPLKPTRENGPSTKVTARANSNHCPPINKFPKIK